jgi:lysyl-tRNA synthetase class 2
VAERFEVYLKGMELANGYHELSDAGEQRQRFKADLAYRKRWGLREVPMDGFLLAALAQGLPDCAGVALGVDRLLMLLLGSSHIEEVLAFPIDRI